MFYRLKKINFNLFLDPFKRNKHDETNTNFQCLLELFVVSRFYECWQAIVWDRGGRGAFSSWIITNLLYFTILLFCLRWKQTDRV